MRFRQQISIASPLVCAVVYIFFCFQRLLPLKIWNKIYIMQPVFFFFVKKIKPISTTVALLSRLIAGSFDCAFSCYADHQNNVPCTAYYSTLQVGRKQSNINISNKRGKKSGFFCWLSKDFSSRKSLFFCVCSALEKKDSISYKKRTFFLYVAFSMLSYYTIW